MGERLRWAREYRRLSQEQLAITSISSQSLVASLELDKRKPRDSSLVKLSMRLSVDFTWLRDGIGAPFQRDVLQDDKAMKLLKIVDIKKRIELARNLQDRELKALFDSAELPNKASDVSEIFKDIAGTPRDDALHSLSISLAVRFEWLKYGEGSPYIGDSKIRNDLGAYIQRLPLPEGDIQAIFDIVRLSAICLYVESKAGNLPDKHIFKPDVLDKVSSYLPRIEGIEHKDYIDL